MLDYLDEYGVNFPWRSFQRQPAGAPRPKVPPLTQEEEDSLLGKVAGAGLGGLAYAGGVLEKTFGKRALMGGLTGNARELLSVIPGSDTFGLTDPDERVGGRELLRHYGLAGAEDNWGNFLGGLALDIGMDPSTYLSFGGGALTQGGKVAKAAGQLPATASGRVGTTLNQLFAHGPPTPALQDALTASGKTLAQIGDMPLGYSVGFGLPFRPPVAGLGESGIAAGNAVKQGLGVLDRGARAVPVFGSQYGWMADKAGQAADWAARHAISLLDSTAKGATSWLGINTAREASAAELPFVAAMRHKAMGYADDLALHGLDPTGDVLREVAEGTFHGPVHPVLDRVAKSMRQDLDDVLARLQNLGVNVQELVDLEANYIPRYWTPLTKPTGGVLGRPRQALATADPRLTGRREFLTDVPGGTAALNRLATDADVYNAATDLVRNEMVRERYLNFGAATPERARLSSLSGRPRASLTPAEAVELDQLTRRFNQGEELAAWMRGLDPQYSASGNANLAGVSGVQEPLRFFGNHPLVDYQTYMDRVSRVLGAAEASQNLFARMATTGVPASAKGQVYMTARDAMRRAGLVGPGGALPGGEAELLARFNAMRGAPVGGAAGPGQAAASALDLLIPEQAVNEVTRYMRGFTAPDAVSAIGGLFDKLTNWTKAAQTAMWPAFHVRNLMSGAWQNWVKGINEAPGGIAQAYRDALALSKGGVIGDANLIADFARRGLSADEATREIARELYAYGVGGHLPHLTRETIGPGGDLVSLGTNLDSFRGRVVGTNPTPSLGQIARNYVPTTGEAINPLNIAGVGANADLFAPVAAGRQLGDVVENLNRNSLYVSLRRQGYTPESAAREVLGAHFDYTRAAKTDFEKAIASRAIPFYTYTRQNIPFQLQQLMERPGGLGGQAAKLSLAARQDAGFLPEYLGGGLAIPTGQEDASGTRRYLTRFDFPPEQAFEMLRGGPNWLPNTLMGLMGQVNPLVKAPVEYATGKQFYTGRDLGDLHSKFGVLPDQILANSPLSRAATTVRTLADERKWQDLEAMAAIPLNLLTGVRVSDVDVQRARDVAARGFIKAGLQGNEAISKFESFAPKAGAEAYLTPEEWAILRLSRTLETQAQDRARAQRQGR